MSMKSLKWITEIPWSQLLHQLLEATKKEPHFFAGMINLAGAGLLVVAVIALASFSFVGRIMSGAKIKIGDAIDISLGDASADLARWSLSTVAIFALYMLLCSWVALRSIAMIERFRDARD